jgi:hypothetical protein
MKKYAELKRGDPDGAFGLGPRDEDDQCREPGNDFLR